MIHVTARAKEKLSELKSQKLAEINSTEANVGLRLDQASPGQLGVFPDAQRDGDEVVEHQGAPLLFVAASVAQAVSGTTIDCEEEGGQLVIRRG